MGQGGIDGSNEVLHWRGLLLDHAVAGFAPLQPSVHEEENAETENQGRRPGVGAVSRAGSRCRAAGAPRA